MTRILIIGSITENIKFKKEPKDTVSNENSVSMVKDFNILYYVNFQKSLVAIS